MVTVIYCDLIVPATSAVVTSAPQDLRQRVLLPERVDQGKHGCRSPLDPIMEIRR